MASGDVVHARVVMYWWMAAISLVLAAGLYAQYDDQRDDERRREAVREAQCSHARNTLYEHILIAHEGGPRVERTLTRFYEEMWDPSLIERMVALGCADQIPTEREVGQHFRTGP